MIKPGAARKSPFWRAGSWICGVLLLVALFWVRDLVSLCQAFLLFLLGLLFTAPYAIGQMRGEGPYRPQPDRVRVREIGPFAYIAYTLLYKTPVYIGDKVYTAVWNAIASRRARPTDERIVYDVTAVDVSTQKAVEHDPEWWGR